VNGESIYDPFDTSGHGLREEVMSALYYLSKPAFMPHDIIPELNVLPIRP